MSEPFIPPAELGDDKEKDVAIKRAVIESENMCHEFVSKIKLTKQPAPIHQIQQAIAQQKLPPEIAQQMMMRIPAEAIVENLYWQGWELH